MRALLAALLLCATLAAAARAYTAEQRNACEPDARRLCTIGQLIEARARPLRRHHRVLPRASARGVAQTLHGSAAATAQAVSIL